MHTIPRIEHIGEAQWADALVVAPATANILAKFAHGIADDFLTTMYLATTAPVLVAPAMNVNMWEHPATQANLEILRQRGVRVIEPGTGELACGMVGAGGWPSPRPLPTPCCALWAAATIWPAKSCWSPPAAPARRSTRSASSATAPAARWATRWPRPRRAAAQKSFSSAGRRRCIRPRIAKLIRVTTADEMREAVLERMTEATLVIKAAAVADYRPVTVSEQKLKRTGPLTLELAPTEDILAEVVRRRRPGQLIVGFAAETENRMENGRAKLLAKGADAIVVNDVSGEGVGFDVGLQCGHLPYPFHRHRVARDAQALSSPTASWTRF